MRRTWYLTALVPLAIGIAIAAISVVRMMGHVEKMPRVVMPGEHTLVLDAGDYVGYGELESVVDGTVYRTEHILLRCAMLSETGATIPLARSETKTEYALGNYSGMSLFEFSLDAATKVRLKCESDKGKAVLAIGGGIGASIVVAFIAGLLGFVGAIVVLVVVFIRRRRWLRARAQA